MKHQAWIYALASVTVLVAFQNCGNNANVDKPAPPVEKFEGEAKAIVGDWAQACEAQTSSSGSKYSTRLKLKVQSDGQFVLETATYADENCETHSMSLSFAGSIEALPGDLLKGAMDSVLLTHGNATLVSQYNKGNVCGKNDWQVGVAKNLMGLTCVDVTYSETIAGGTEEVKIFVAGLANTVKQFPIAIDRTPFTLDEDLLSLDGFTMNGQALTTPFVRQ